MDDMTKIHIENYIKTELEKKGLEAVKYFVSMLHVRGIFKGTVTHSVLLKLLCNDKPNILEKDIMQRELIKHMNKVVEIVFEESPDSWTAYTTGETLDKGIDFEVVLYPDEDTIRDKYSGEVNKPNERCFNCGHYFYAKNWHTPPSCPKCHWSRVN